MPYIIGTKREGVYDIYVTALDGDSNKVRPLDQSPDMGDIAPAWNYATICGRTIDTTHLPTRLRKSGGRQKVPDFLGSSVGVLVSHKVRDIVEEFEPGVHGFHPMAFEKRDKTQVQTHFLWVFHHSIKALNPEGLTPAYPGPDDWWDGLNKRLHPDGHAIFSKAAIGDAHAWSDPQLMYRRFLSDELTQALLNAEVTGFAPGRHIEAV